MNMHNINRRKFLISAVALPFVGLLPAHADVAKTKLQSKLHKIEGAVLVNKQQIGLDAHIQSGDEIVVPPDGQLIFTMGNDAYLLRGGSVLQVKTNDNLLVGSLRLLTGAMLGVFGKRSETTHIYTRNATIGIRGTAVYVDVNPSRVYTCTCYGHTDLIVGNHRKEVISKHHYPHVISTSKSGKNQIKANEMKGHNDDELRMLEALVGRKPSFDV